MSVAIDGAGVINKVHQLQSWDLVALSPVYVLLCIAAGEFASIVPLKSHNR